MDNRERVCLIALNKLYTYDPAGARELIEQVGSASYLFDLPRGTIPQIESKLLRLTKSVSSGKLLEESQKELEWAETNGIELVFATDPDCDYPVRLLECYDHPIVLYKKGKLSLNQRKVLGVVGTRRATVYGKTTVNKIIDHISTSLPGTLIVSGLAYGIDIEAHIAAIRNGLPTVAVLGCGLDNIYPAAHTSHAIKIASSGALVTEFPKKSEGYKINFLRRNRIIAGLCDAVVVIESGIKGGSTITASLATGYNRDVFAIPGRISDVMSEGCNKLISENRAGIFTTVEDLAEVLGWEFTNPSEMPCQKSLFGTGCIEKEKILVALKSNEELDIDTIISKTRILPQKLLGYLLDLELEGKIAVHPGKRYSVL